MNDATVIALAIAGIVAVVDWIAVHGGRRSLEYVAKPGTMVALIAAALLLDPSDPTVRTWFVVALVASTIGDVFLMLPRDLFVPGLISFLLGHIAYIIGLWSGDTGTGGLVLGLATVALILPPLGVRILRAVRASSEPELTAPVAVYMSVISAMVVSAGASGSPVAFGGALSFYASDALIAWTRFIQDHRFGRLAVIVTYHLAQFALVASLV